MVVRNIFDTIFAFSAFVFTVATIYSLTDFVSRQNNASVESVIDDTKFQESKINLWPLFADLIYCYVFVFQHWFMSVDSVKKFFTKFGFGVLQRSIYVALTNLALGFLMIKWRTVTYGALWLFDTRKDELLWWIFACIQWFGWSVVFGGCVMMDLGELLGVKQVWYSICNLPDPMIKKSRELESLYRHMRHPSLIGFFIVLWIHPHMTLDRFLLAFVFTAYILGFFTMDSIDYAYQREQLLRKRETVSYRCNEIREIRFDKKK